MKIKVSIILSVLIVLISINVLNNEKNLDYTNIQISKNNKLDESSYENYIISFMKSVLPKHKFIYNNEVNSAYTGTDINPKLKDPYVSYNIIYSRFNNPVIFFYIENSELITRKERMHVFTKDYFVVENNFIEKSVIIDYHHKQDDPYSNRFYTNSGIKMTSIYSLCHDCITNGTNTEDIPISIVDSFMRLDIPSKFQGDMLNIGNQYQERLDSILHDVFNETGETNFNVKDYYCKENITCKAYDYFTYIDGIIKEELGYEG